MKRYCLVGYPVKNSISPAMHNAAFRHLGIDAEYILIEKNPRELEDFYAHFKEGFSGCNVTIPHKETTIRHLDEVRGEAKAIGAVNTVVVEKGRLIGYNTDVTGFVKALREDLGFDPKAKRAGIFGAGGAARAVSFGLHSMGIKELVLTDIDADKAAGLAMDLAGAGCNAAAIEHNKEVMGNLTLSADLVVNATPLGMKKEDAELLSAKFLYKNISVFDLIYNPPETPLLKAARKKGCRAANGLGMLLYQGAESFKLWTGREAPVGVMRKALKEALTAA